MRSERATRPLWAPVSAPVKGSSSVGLSVLLQGLSEVCVRHLQPLSWGPNKMVALITGSNNGKNDYSDPKSEHKNAEMIGVQ